MPGREDWTPDGYVAYSKLCTHLGCPVGLYEKELEVLVCPEDKGPLLYFHDEDRLYNPRLKRSYPIHDDIPVMLIDEAKPLE